MPEPPPSTAGVLLLPAPPRLVFVPPRTPLICHPRGALASRRALLDARRRDPSFNGFASPFQKANVTGFRLILSAERAGQRRSERSLA